MPMFEPCRGATSDHAWRSIAVNFLNRENQSTCYLQGATWNMQAKCESLEANKKKSNGNPNWVPHGNNPLDIDESSSAYVKRKTQQIEELKSMMRRDHDFIFLQEPDWLGRPHVEPLFRQLLDDHDWDMVVTPGPAYQKLVTFYRKNTLTPIPGSERGHFVNSYGKFRGFEANFIHHPTHQKIALVNLHLEYGKDYRDDMLNLQKQMSQDDLPCIMGGDTNNVQNLQLSTMIGDWHAATCIERDHQGGLTTKHETGANRRIEKTYDGFFVNPGRNTRAHIIDQGGMRFKECGQGQVAYVKYQPTAHHHYHSDFGQPWQRRPHRQIQIAPSETPSLPAQQGNRTNSFRAPRPAQPAPISKNPYFALALLASSIVACVISIAMIVMIPPLGIGLGVAGLVISAGMFRHGMHSLRNTPPNPSMAEGPQIY